MAPLPYATDEQAALAIAHVSCVLLAAKNGNQHNENMVVLMDQATAMFQRIAKLEEALKSCAISRIAGYGVRGDTTREQLIKLASDLYEEIRRLEGIARAALSTPPPQID